jgi:hypothetical protein
VNDTDEKGSDNKNLGSVMEIYSSLCLSDTDPRLTASISTIQPLMYRAREHIRSQYVVNLESRADGRVHLIQQTQTCIRKMVIR